MPIFDFTCTKCNLQFEKITSLSKSEEGVTCPCDEKAFAEKNKVFNFNFSLKGNWFKNNQTY